MDLRGLPVEQVCGGVQVNSKCNHILNEVIIEIIEDGSGIAEIIPNEKGSTIVLL
jgi:hypothetical protein